MARKKPKPPIARPTGDLQTPTLEANASEPEPRRDVRSYIYSGCDALLVVLWSVLLSTALANRHGWAAALLWSLVFFGVVMAAGMLVPNRWGWRAAAAGCVGLLVVWLVVVVTLILSAAYLAGVYGAFGRGAAMGTLAIGALSIQLIALVPALQLKYLLTRAGRRHFGQEPLWS